MRLFGPRTEYFSARVQEIAHIASNQHKIVNRHGRGKKTVDGGKGRATSFALGLPLTPNAGNLHIDGQ